MAQGSPNGRSPAEEPLPDLELRLLPPALAAMADELGRVWQQKPNPHALTGLAVLLVAVGANVEIVMPGGDKAPALDWFVLVGESGSGKSPIMEALLEPVRRRQQDWTNRYLDEMHTFKDRAAMGKRASAVPGQAAPEKPVMQALLFDDSTYEAMTQELADYNAGSVWYSDELLGLFNSLDAYKPRGGRSLQGLLSTWRAGPIRRKRIRDNELTIVNRPVLSVLGGIQPSKVHELGDNGDGRLARMLAVVVEEGDDPTGDPREELKARWTALVLSILDSRPHSLQTVGMDRAAWQVWVRRAKELRTWFKTLPKEEQTEIRPFVSKLTQHAARLALALWAGMHERAWPLPALDAETAEAAWELALTLLQHQLRIFGPAQARIGLRSENIRMSEEVERFHAWLSGKYSPPVPRREVQSHCKIWRGGMFGAVVDEWKRRGYGRQVPQGRVKLLDWED